MGIRLLLVNGIHAYIVETKHEITPIHSRVVLRSLLAVSITWVFKSSKDIPQYVNVADSRMGYRTTTDSDSTRSNVSEVTCRYRVRGPRSGCVHVFIGTLGVSAVALFVL